MIPLIIFKRGPAQIDWLSRAGTRAFIEVRAALRAESATFVAAQSAHWQHQLNLLAHQIVYVNRLALIKSDRKIIVVQLMLIACAKRRQVEQIEALFDGRR